MRKAVIPVLLALSLAALPLSAQENKKKKAIDLEQEFFQLPDSVTNEWLDATPLPKKARINDYWIVGVHGGVSLQYGYYNPPRQTRFYPNLPVWGVSITRFATMMNTFPNLGMEVGFQHNYEGYNFKEYEVDKDTYRQDIDGYHEAYMEVPEVFILTHGHIDMGQYAKINLKLGMYGGYRMNIHRIHDKEYPVYYDTEIADAFRDTDNRWSYGVQGGLGFGLMFDPIEVHLGVQVKWGWSSFYKPDDARRLLPADQAPGPYPDGAPPAGARIPGTGKGTERTMTMETRVVKVGDVLIGGNNPVVVQTMCNTHTYDVDATVAQTLRLAKAGAQLVRITVPGLQDVPHVREIKARVRAAGCSVPLVADIHFSSETAIAVASVVEKVRINPGNFHKDHAEARRQFALFLEECKKYGTAIRIGLNHGSLGAYIVEKYGNTPRAMALAAMEWVEMCLDAEFYQVVVSLKASNTVVMIEAYRELARMMQERGVVFPLHVGVTEAGNGDSGRIKSCVAISTLLSEGIGNTVRVSLTEDPENEIPVAQYLADRYSPQILTSVSDLLRMTDDGHFERSEAESRNLSDRDRTILKAACDYGKPLLDRTIDTVSFPELEPAFGAYLADELLQACRRKFYRPEYIACPGCGRTMYNLQEAFEAVKARTGHLKDVVIAVMGCIVNGPGEMADADWGYVGEGGGKVTIYRGKEPVLRHIPDSEAVDKLVGLIESEQ